MNQNQQPIHSLGCVGVSPIRAVRESQVYRALAVSRSELRRMIRAGRFPAGVKLSPRVVIWDARVVDKWLEDKFSREGA